MGQEYLIKKLEKENALLQRELHDATERAAFLRRFIEKMSYDIKAPMQTIMDMTALLRQTTNLKEVEEDLDRIDFSSQLVFDIANELKDMDMIKTGRFQLFPTEFDLSALISSISAITYNNSSAKEVDYVVNMKDIAAERLYADKGRINQILSVLLSNAVKHTESGGKITFQITQLTRNEKLFLKFVVIDTGCGIAGVKLNEIWNPTYSTSIALSKHIAEIMGGSLSVKSEKGVGSSFVFETPVEPIHNELIKISDIMREYRVMLVANDLETRNNVENMFVRLGINYAIVDSCEDAIYKYKKAQSDSNPYDMVIVDWAVAGVSALTVVRELRKQLPSCKISILAPSKSKYLSDAVLLAGADHILAKPLFQTVLYNFLTEVSGRQYTKFTAETNEYNFKGKRVLLAEDNELSCEVAKSLLEMVGFEVDCASNGKEALRKFSTSMIGYYDAILMDINMPEMDGYEATTAIKALDRSDSNVVPIIALTANAFPEDIEMAHKKGLVNHLPKPIDTKNMYETLNNCLARKK